MFIMLGRVAPSTACHAANFESSLVNVSVIHHCRRRCVNCIELKNLQVLFSIKLNEKIVIMKTFTNSNHENIHTLL
jgi:hypothetical protein